MTLTADSLVLLFTNERDKLLKAFENRLVQFELRMHLLLEKQPKWDCLKQENRVLEIVSTIETVFGKFTQQMLSSDGMQKKLLKQLEILNESELLKQNQFSSHDLSTLNVDGDVDDVDPKQENMDLEESIKNEISGYSFGNTGNCSAQDQDDQNNFEFVHIPPLVPVIPLFKNEKIDFDGQIMHENNGRNVGLEKEKSCNDAFNAQTSLSIMPSHHEADNTNDPLYFCNDAPLSIDKAYEVNVDNPPVRLEDVKEETNDTAKEISWPMETSGCNETPCSRISNDDMSLFNDTTQFKSKVIEHDNGVEIEGKAVDQSVDVFDKNAKLNQLTSTTDQSQPDGCYKCERCDRLFADEEVFKRHMKVKHRDRSVVKRYKCEFCSYSSNHNGHLKRHLRVHTKEKPFQCTVSSKRFAQKYQLQSHILIHTKECPYECNKCGKKFSLLSSMQRHIRTVHDKCKPFVCNVCGYAFGEASNLNNHMPIHTGVRKYKCQYCDKRFSHCSSMRKHERIHTGEKPHKCKECSAAFAQSSNLHTHVIRHHTKKYPYRCSVCDKGYVITSQFKKHESRCCES